MAINRKKPIGDILKVFASNVFKLLASVLVGFILPKIINVPNYGYYKTFTLYATYVGLLHFGFIDGIYLMYGGKNYEELDKSLFRLFSRVLFIIEIAFTVILGAVGLFALPGEYKFIFVCLAVYLLAMNITSYYQFISQITSRFNEFSIRTIIQSVLTCIAIAVLWIISKVNGTLLSYRIYTIIFVGINIMLVLWYIFTYRDITFGKAEKFKNNKKIIGTLFAIGFPLMVSNLTSSLILSLDRQFVNILFENSVYAVYAFAYNMLNLITVALTAISAVLYPNMKKADKNSLTQKYSTFITAILGLVFGCLIAYFPLCPFVGWLLPNYVDSLPIFRVILPGLAMSSAVTVIMHNYYKIEGKTNQFFIKSLIILAISFGANVIAYVCFKTTISISIASVITTFIWYIVMEEYFIRKYKVKWLKNLIYMLLMTGLFYVITIWDVWWAAMLAYIAAFLLITYALHFKDINNLFNNFKNRHKNKVETQEVADKEKADEESTTVIENN